MNLCEDRLFPYADLPAVAPWLTEESCRHLIEAGLFTPRMVFHEAESEGCHIDLCDLIALTCMMQMLRLGITPDHLREAVSAPSSYRPYGLSADQLFFYKTRAISGQQFSRFLDMTNGEATILVRHCLEGEAEIQFISNDHLGAGDFLGPILTGIECKAIRDTMMGNILSAGQKIADPTQGGRVPRQNKSPLELFFSTSDSIRKEGTRNCTVTKTIHKVQPFK